MMKVKSDVPEGLSNLPVSRFKAIDLIKKNVIQRFDGSVTPDLLKKLCVSFQFVEGGAATQIILNQNGVDMVVKEFLISREEIAFMKRANPKKVITYGDGFVRCWCALAELLTCITRGEKF